MMRKKEDGAKRVLSCWPFELIADATKKKKSIHNNEVKNCGVIDCSHPVLLSKHNGEHRHQFTR